MSTEYILALITLEIVVLDMFIYLVMVWWNFTGKNNIKDVHSPAWHIIKKTIGKNKSDGDIGFLYYGGFLAIFGAAISMICVLLVSVHFPFLKVATVITSFILLTYCVRVIKTIFSAVKKLVSIAHKHTSDTSCVDIDISMSVLSDSEKELIRKVRSKVKR